ncbi:hypothetical protein AWR38_00995 [Idiomarina sp. WRN-38]|nr:hypothetical protein AUR68_00990 [Idiomarina sp. H105]OAE96003.1 hypothetical protein AWR38_00995 [Idiomarina sp. WRN-38]
MLETALGSALCAEVIMAKPIIYTLKIENTSPSEAPMQWVAEYISEYAKMLGCKEHVHLSNIRDNCIALDASITPQYNQAVSANISRYKIDHRAAFDRFDRLLRKHGHWAALFDQHGVLQAEFPGIKKPEETPLTIQQTSSMQGTLVWIGGESELSIAHLSIGSGRTIKCRMPRNMAKVVSKYLYEEFVFSGTASWHRDDEGKWCIEDYLHVKSYELLSDNAIDKTLGELRSSMGEWSQTDYVEEIVDRIRQGE